MRTPRHLARLSFHGILEIDAVGATAEHLEHLESKYGLITTQRERPPDVTIRFEESLGRGDLVHLRLVAAAMSDAGFHLVDEIRQHPIATIPFGSLDGPCEVAYLSGSSQMPHLTEILRLALLRHSYVCVQAAAFEYAGEGFLVLGWPKSGKTGALLGSVAHGSRILGDEWIAVAVDGRSMVPLQPTVTISDWQLPQMEGVVELRGRRAFKPARLLERAYARGLLPRSELLDRAIPRLMRALNVTVPARAVADVATRVGPSKVFLLEATRAAEPEASGCDPGTVAARAAVLNQFEWSRFRDLYLAWCFMHPGAGDPAMEKVQHAETVAIDQAFSGLAASVVRHTYPGSMSELFACLAASALRPAGEAPSGEPHG